MTYLLTGVTGRLGRAVLDELLTQVAPTEVVVTVRNMKQAQPFLDLGVTVRQADFTQPDGLVAAFSGIDRLLLISSQPSPTYSRLQQHTNAIMAAKQAGVPYIAYTSIANASNSNAILAPDHAQTEQVLADSGLAYTTIRNNWYLENELAVLEQARADRRLVHAAGQGQVGWALIAEYAAGIVAVLLSEQPKAVYEFGGALHTYEDLAKALETVVQTPITVETVSVADYQVALSQQGVDAASAQFAAGIQNDIQQGALEVPTDDLAQLLKQPLVSLEEGIARILPQ